MNMRLLSSTTMAALAVFAVVGTSSAADVTLRFAHFWPAVSETHKELFQVWADSVGKESGGKIKVELYPSATLAKPPAQYEAVKSGIADVTATVQGYTANRFPLTQVVELPGLVSSAPQGSCMIQTLYQEGLISSEYEDSKPLFLFTHGPGLIHTKDKLIKSPEDFAGLRIRRPTTVVGQLLEQLGAQPVGMPAPESYQSMQRGVIDGVSLPWEGAYTFRLLELANKHTEVGGLYTLSFLVTMNKGVYDGLSDDLKKVIDHNSGMEWTTKAGKIFDSLDVKGRAVAEKDGHEIYTVEGGIENPEWKSVLAGSVESYLADLEKKGLPARKVYARALELSKTCK